MKKIHKKICFGLIMLVILEAPDLFLDWDFYIEVINSEQPEVKRDTASHIAILVFSIVGSVTFTIEFMNLILVMCCDGCTYFLPGSFSIFTTLVEDIPQLGLALHIAVIEDTTITYVQFGKAGFAVFEALVRTLILSYYIHKKNKLLENLSELHTKDMKIKEKKWVAVSQLVLFVIILVSSGLIFYFLLT